MRIAKRRGNAGNLRLMIVRIPLRTVRSLLRSSIKLQLLFKSLPLSLQRYEAQEHD